MESQRTSRRFIAPYYLAVAICGLARRQEALERLDEIEAEASTTGWLLRVGPLLDPIRDDAGSMPSSGVWGWRDDRTGSAPDEPLGRQRWKLTTETAH